MKAISLWQPWASFMAIGIKQNETRHWSTNHRGELAICSSKKRDIDLSVPVAILLCNYADALGVYGGNAGDIFDALPFGFVVCVVSLHDVRTTDWENRRINYTERTCGNYEPDRFAWRTVALRRLREPVPVTGGQGLFNLPPDVEAKVRAQI